jgi:hypothetical protein
MTNQIFTNDDEFCIPRLSSILLAVPPAARLDSGILIKTIICLDTQKIQI